MGYSFLSLHLASSAENLQRTVEQTEFLFITQALTWRCISSKEARDWDWDRHCLERMPISISAIFSQEA